MTASHSQIENITSDLKAARARVHRLEQDFPEEQWEKRNDPNRWSIAECIEHLNLTTQAYIPVLTAALSGAPPLRTKRNLHRDFVGVLLGALTAPIRTIAGFQLGKMPTTRDFEPSAALARDDVVRNFESGQNTLLAFASDAENYEIDRVKIASPFNPKVRYNIYSALRIVAGHQHRHLAQAEAVWSDGVRPATR